MPTVGNSRNEACERLVRNDESRGLDGRECREIRGMKRGAAEHEELAERAVPIVPSAFRELRRARLIAEVTGEQRRGGLRRPTVGAEVKVSACECALHREGEQAQNDQTRAPLRASQAVQ